MVSYSANARPLPDPIRLVRMVKKMGSYAVELRRHRPHPPRADGEEDGELAPWSFAATDPIRLVRMVKKMGSYSRGVAL